MPLNLTDFNQFYVINKICGQEKQRHYLESLGFVPGARISILSELHGYYLVMVKGSKIGLDHRAFALLIILTLLGCASALTLTDYLKSLIRRNGADRFNPFFFRIVAPDPHLFFLLRRNLLHQKFHHPLPPLDLMIIPCQAVCNLLFWEQAAKIKR